MATNKSTKLSSASSATEKRPQLDDLVLPEGSDFITFPPEVPLKLMCRYVRMLRRSFPESIPTDEERLRAKVNVEFVL